MNNSDSQDTTRKQAWIGAAVFLFALAVGFAAVRARGPIDRVMTSGDGRYYIGIARDLAAGKGYQLPGSPWPDQPYLERLPGWPVLLAIPCMVLRGANDFVVLRVTTMVVHALACALLALLAFRLRPEPRAALLAGIFFAIFPSELTMVDSGISEPAFLFYATAGILLLFGSGWRQFAGAVLMGLAALTRSSFAILPLVAGAAAWWLAPHLRQHWKRGLACIVLFYIPLGLWMARNAAVSGAFPVINSIEGETLYGANNPDVAESVQLWGDWVYPDHIPGETPKLELARRLDQIAISRYYRHNALAYMRANALLMPRLIVGKLVRGFIPVPWVPFVASYASALFRILLYAVFFLTACNLLRHNPAYSVLLWGVFASTLITTVIFYGAPRFTLLVESYMIPPAAVGLVNWLSSRAMKARPGSGSTVAVIQTVN
jgi:hypothetical protein